jgi:peptidoglycan/LPS O-acetylase OafA/YrhL
MEDRGFNLFGLNAPSWSLFWEYVANIVYALVLSRVKRPVLIVITAISAVLLGYVAFSATNLLGGWSGPTFWHGGARIAYSFSAGLLIYRSNWIIKNSLGFIGLAILLSLAFLMPSSSFNWLTELGVVLIYFPLIVALGAGARVAPGLKKICVLSGRISYPLYMTHYAVIWIFGHYFTTYKPGTGKLALIICIGTILLLVVAWVTMVVFDTPVRKYLTNRRRPVV